MREKWGDFGRKNRPDNNLMASLGRTVFYQMHRIWFLHCSFASAKMQTGNLKWAFPGPHCFDINKVGVCVRI